MGGVHTSGVRWLTRFAAGRRSGPQLPVSRSTSSAHDLCGHPQPGYTVARTPSIRSGWERGQLVAGTVLASLVAAAAGATPGQAQTSAGSAAQSASLPPALSGFASTAANEARSRQSAQAALLKKLGLSALDGLSDGDAVGVAEGLLPDLFNHPMLRGLLTAADQKIRYTGPTTAMITTPGGSGNVAVQSTLPLRARNNDTGQLDPVDLSLRPDPAGGFRPANPVVPTTLPARLSQTASIGGLWGMRVAGNETAGRLTGSVVSYPNAMADTDVLWAPTPLGAMLLAQIRSAAGPQDIPVDVSVPDGAKLTTSTTASGAIEILGQSGTPLGRIDAPRAWDASGAAVPVSYAVDGTTVHVRVMHRDRPVAYPVIVDPGGVAYVNFGSNGLVGAADGWVSLGTNFLFVKPNTGGLCYRYGVNFDSTGLCVYAVRNHNYGAYPTVGEVGQWYFAAPNSMSYIARFDISAAWTAGVSGGGLSTVTEGIASGTAAYNYWGNSPDSGTPPVPGPHPTHAYFTASANAALTYTSNCQTMTCDYSAAANAGGTGAFFNTKAYGTYGSSDTVGSIDAEGLAVYEGDKDNPTFDSANPPTANDTTHWLSGGLTATATVLDQGLGVYGLAAQVPRTNGNYDYVIQPSNDSATTSVPNQPDGYTPPADPAAVPFCGAPRYPACKASYRPQTALALPTSSTTSQGHIAVKVTGTDFLGKAVTSSLSYWVDTIAPTADVSGSLKTNDGLAVPDGTYSLTVNGHDGSTSSGVASIAVTRDGQTLGTYAAPNCLTTSPYSCPADVTSTPFTLSTAGLSAGLHQIVVKVTDVAGNSTTLAPIKIYVDHAAPTVTSFTHSPAPSGWYGSGTSTFTSTLAATDDVSGIKSFTVAVPKTGGGTQPFTTTRTCTAAVTTSGACLTSDSAAVGWKIDATTPDGPQSVQGTASDAVGQTSAPQTVTVNVDRTPPPTVTPSGTLYSARTMPISATGDLTLHLAASDSVGGQYRSGVGSINVQLDHASSSLFDHSSVSQTCTSSASQPCDLAGDFVLHVANLASGTHTISYTATDQAAPANTTTEASFQIVVDRAKPSVTVTHSPAITGWSDDMTRTVTAAGHDDDSGVASLAFTRPTSTGPVVATYGATCTTGATPCPKDVTHPFAYPTSDMPEGIDQLSVTALDAAGNTSDAANFQLHLDRSAPTVALSGPLTNQPLGVVAGGAYTVQVDATDGSASAPRSGVKSIDYYVDSKLARHYDVPGCTTDGCPYTAQDHFDYNVQTYGTGQHTVQVTVTDQVGHTTSPAPIALTAAAGASTTQSTLGHEDWMTYDQMDSGGDSTASVNLASGNLLWTHTLLSNPGPGLSTFVRTTYNAMEPAPLGETYSLLGQGMSVQASGLTRVNEPLGVTVADVPALLGGGIVTLTDGDGTRHTFTKTTDADGRERWVAPAGVHLWLRRFSAAPPLLGSEPRRWAITRPDGVTYYFDQDGYQTFITDRNGNTLTFAYAAVPAPQQLTLKNCGNAPAGCAKQLASITDQGGRSVAFTYYSDTTATASTDGHVAGDLQSITDHAGRVTTFTYRIYGLSVPGVLGTPVLSTITEGTPTGPSPAADASRSRTLSWTYTALSNVTQLIGIGDPRNNTTTIGYDTTASAGRVLTMTDRRGSAGDRRTYGYGTSGSDTLASITEPYTDIGGSGSRVTNFTMDARGRLTRLTDARGTVTTQQWDNDPGLGRGQDQNNLARRVVNAADLRDSGTDPRARAHAAVTDWIYNDTGDDHGATVQSITDPNGHTTSFTYTRSNGTQQSSQSTAGSSTFDAGRTFVQDLHTTTSARGNAPGANAADFTTTLTRDAYGNVTERDMPDGTVQTATYNGATPDGSVTHLLDSSTDPRKPGDPTNVTHYGCFDQNGLPRTRTDARGQTWLTGYDTVGNTTSITDPRGVSNATACPGTHGAAFTASYVYDSRDRKISEQIPKDSAHGLFVSRSFQYDANDDQTQKIDATGAQWSTSYTATDQVKDKTAPATPHYGDSAASAERTTYDYDTFDNLAAVHRPLSAGGFTHTTRYLYDPVDEQILQDQSTSATPAAAGDLLTSMAYDPRGNLIGLSDPNHNTGATLATALAHASDPVYQRAAYEYDKADNRTASIEDPHNLRLRTERTYNADDQVATETDPAAFDSDGDGKGNVDSSGAFGSPASGHTTTYTYDERDLLTHVTDQLGRDTAYTVRGDGKVTDQITPKGTASSTVGDYDTKLDYWPTGELKSRSIPYDPGQYGSHNLQVTYQINQVGDPINIVDGRGDISDHTANLGGMTDTGPHTIKSTFYDTGELKSTSRPSWWTVDGTSIRERTPQDPAPTDATAGGLPSDAGAGDLGQVKAMSMPDALPRAGQTAIQYDPEMRLSDITDSAGLTSDGTLGSDSLSHTQKWLYDAEGRPTEHSYPPASGDRITMRTQYDLDGNVAATTPGADTQTADQGGQSLLSTYTYDLFDRRTGQEDPGANTPDIATGPDRRTTGYTLDANGNPVTISTPRTGYNEVRNYDDTDRLIADRDPLTPGNSSSTTETDYRYDANGNRAAMIAPRGNAGPGAANPGDYTTTYTYDGANQLKSELLPSVTGATSTTDRTVSYQYDPDGNQTSVIAPGAASDPGASVKPITTTSTFDGRDLPWTVTTGTGTSASTTISEYDGNGELRRTVNPAGVDQSADVPVPKTAVGDEEDPVTATSAFTKNATVNDYSPDGLLTATYLPWGSRDNADQQRWRQEFTYNDRGWPTTISSIYRWNGTNHADTAQHYGYYPNGWPQSSSDATLNDAGQNVDYSQQIDYSYDTEGNQTQWSSVGGSRKIDRAYWPSGDLRSRQASRIDSTGTLVDYRSYGYQYDRNGAMTAMVDNQPPEASSACLTPSPNPSLSCPTRTTSISRDGSERPVTINESWSTGKDTRYHYLPGGDVDNVFVDGRVNTAGALVGGVEMDYGWDARDRNISESYTYDPSTSDPTPTLDKHHTFTMSYWPSGAISREQTPYGRDEHRYYADDSRITLRTTGASGDPSPTSYTYGYDSDRNRTTDERGTYAYNSRDQLVHWHRDASGQMPERTSDYTIDGDGQITHRTDAYTVAGTASSTDTANTYVGDRLTSSVTSGTGQPTVSSAYAYDTFGAQIHITTTTAGSSGPVQETRYKFDPFERLTRSWSTSPVDEGTGQSPSAGDTVYCYDGLDRRDRRVKLSAHDAASFDTGSGGAVDAEQNPCSAAYNNATGLDYSYLGLTHDLTREARPDGSVDRYEYDASGHALARGKQPTTAGALPASRSYEADANGSIVGLDSRSSRIATGGDRYHYDPFGDLETTVPGTDAESALSTSARDNALRYEGFYYDSSDHTYDMQARAYRPDIARFLTQDRFEAAAGDIALKADPLTNNPYAFAAGDPIGNIEYNGHYVSDPSGSPSSFSTARQNYRGRVEGHSHNTDTERQRLNLADATSPLTPPNTPAYTGPHATDRPAPKPNLLRAGMSLLGFNAHSQDAAESTLQGAACSLGRGLGIFGSLACSQTPRDANAAERADHATSIASLFPFGFGGLGRSLDELAVKDEVELLPYEEGGGHHMPAKSAFRGEGTYDPALAPSIPNAELDRLGIRHADITGAQATLYRQFAKTGQTLTWKSAAAIERQALVSAGMDSELAGSTVDRAITALRNAGVQGPTRIPWGGR